MLFNSFEFLIFLPLVFLAYWGLCRERTSRNLLIVGASYLFYGWWNPVFLLLIFFTTICSFFSGLLIENEMKKKRKKSALAILWGNVAVNLGILFLFKYFNFFSQSFSLLMATAGWSVDSVTLNLILPVGISFYTFQALSYSIDVYRQDIGATRDILAFVAFISFFPQLVAGPVERATNLLPQFLTPRHFSYAKGVTGMKLILWGLFKKMVVADNAAPIVDHIFANYDSIGSINLWIGAILFSFQIYCDFSGYSDIAVGVARLFGVRLTQNFKLPYFSTSIHDFWKRWHISLTSWFRDYIYIPLGGNRQGSLKTARNATLVFLASGLWHGANYTFILWGAFHALISLPGMWRKKKISDRNHNLVISTLMMGFTFLLVMIGWIFFRADHISQAWHYIGLMFQGLPSTIIMGKTAMVWAGILIIAEWTSRKEETPFHFATSTIWRYRWVRWSVYLSVFLVTLIFAGSSEQFIYFQF